jgi:hypothetical protein
MFPREITRLASPRPCGGARGGGRGQTGLLGALGHRRTESLAAGCGGSWKQEKLKEMPG